MPVDLPPDGHPPSEKPTPTRTAVVSIELTFDAATDAAVRADWARLIEAGMPSLGRHPSPSNSPHVTLLVRTTLEPVEFAAAVALLPIDIELGEPTVFAHGDRGVLVRPVVMDDSLRRLHLAVHDAAPPGEDAPFTAPGDWTPHVTLARRLRLDRLQEALAVLGPAGRGQGVALRRWDSVTATVTTLR
ncbi:2'-5' RNA ligase family protein [Microbacterium sp. 1P10UB]|uniref:2'-5' RNA ligase family protein n=1 Tax=unclassified Microbacterium TaxID=2609290 RepID=UPI0039A2647B